MAEFPHLPLPQKANGLYNAPRGGGSSISTTTLNNLRNRLQHGKKLKQDADNILESWQEKQEARLLEELPELPNSNVIPIFLQIDSEFFDVDSLLSFGIEVISEEESGFIIGAAYLNNQSVYDRIRRNMGGAAITRLTLQKINTVKIILPPLSLQQKFAVIVTNIDQLRQKQGESKGELKNLFQGLLQRYFG